MNSYNNWLDPFFLEDFLDEDEKAIRDSTKKFVQKNLLPNVVKNNRNHFAFEIESVDSSYRSAVFVQSSLICHPIEFFGSEDQKKLYLPGLIKGNKIGCFGLTESEAGSDPSSMKTTFVEKKDHYIINGSKNWITNAPIADIFLIWAMNEKKEIKLFLIPKKTKGLSTSNGLSLTSIP